MLSMVLGLAAAVVLLLCLADGDGDLGDVSPLEVIFAAEAFHDGGGKARTQDVGASSNPVSAISI